MTDQKRVRLSLSFEHWPEHWRELWMAAFDPGWELFDKPGLGAGWAPATRKQTRKGLALFFGSLHRRAVLDPNMNPSSYLTVPHLRPYAEELAARVKPVTQTSRMRDVLVGVRIMEPDADLTLIRRAVRRLQRRAKPSRDKRKSLVPAKTLFEAGIARMDRVQEATYEKADVKAVQYGDGLLIAMAVSTLDRLRNLSNIHIGRNLILLDGGYVLRFEGSETKNKRPHQGKLPRRLTPYINTYIEVHRRQLLQGNDSDHLFISCYRGPMAQQTMYCRFVAATKQELGVPVPPHRVRDIAVTDIATDHPEMIDIAPHLLHHASLGTTQAHYNQATQLDASRQYNAVLEEARKEALAAWRDGDLYKET